MQQDGVENKKKKKEKQEEKKKKYYLRFTIWFFVESFVIPHV